MIMHTFNISLSPKDRQYSTEWLSVKLPLSNTSNLKDLKLFLNLLFDVAMLQDLTTSDNFISKMFFVKTICTIW